MSKEDKKNVEEELPSLNKGVGGAGRVQGFLTDEKAVDTRETLRRLLKEIDSFKWLFLLALILTFVATVSQVLAPRLVGQVITTLAQTFTEQSVIDWETISQLIMVLMILYLLNFVATYISNTTMVRVTQNVVASLRRQMVRKIHHVPLRFFDTSSTGNLTSLLTNDLDNVANTLQTGLTTAITAVVMMVGVLIMMLTIDPLLTLISLVIVPISYGLVKYLIGKAKPIFTRNAHLTGQLNGEIEEAYQGQDIVQNYHLSDDMAEKMKSLNEKLYDSEWKSSYISFMTRPAGDLMLNVNYALVSILGGWNVINGSITIGEFQAFISYTRMFNQPFRQVMGILNTIMSALASAERIFNFLDVAEFSESGTEQLDVDTVEGGIAFDDVVFSYDETDPLFENVDLTIQKGDQIAIVGETGAGKTTLVNLLMRFYEVQEGQILLDGRDTKNYATQELRKAYSMVLQDTWLFEGTIRENIAYGALISDDQDLNAVPQEEVEEAAKLARIHTLIERLPDQYDTWLNEGATNLSQGERQLLTIARAMIKKSPIIILDEATSSVDTRTEVLIQEAMRRLTENETSFVIAHRLSTIRNADRILVMQQGEIVESGTHDELLNQEGVYAEMYLAGQTS